MFMIDKVLCAHMPFFVGLYGHFITSMHICTFVETDCSSPYIERFKDDNDVVGIFEYLCEKVMEFWSEIEFLDLRRKCETLACTYSKQFADKVKAAKDTEGLVCVLKHSDYCNWLNICILKKISDITKVPEAQCIIEDYETCLHSKKVPDVQCYFRAIFFNPSSFSFVDVKINKDFKKIVVKDLIGYCKVIGSILSIPNGSIHVADCADGCLVITLAISIPYFVHVYNTAKKFHHKFRFHHIQYLKFGEFPVICSTHIEQDEDLLSALAIHSKEPGKPVCICVDA